MTTITAHLNDAANHIAKKASGKSFSKREATTDITTTNKDKTRLFLHAEFHPKGIPRRAIRQLYNRTLKKLTYSTSSLSLITARSICAIYSQN
jgi:hypothetical protein